MRARVIVASNRAWAGVYADSSGPILVAGLRQLGFDVEDPVVVADGDPVGEAIRAAVATAGLAMIDMIKAVDPAASIESVRVLRKEGGKTGDWVRPEDRP